MGVWNPRGERWHGKKKQGGYVREKEAAAAGERETENGQ